MQHLLDDLWNFGNPAASEAKFADAIAVLETQRARALGLQERYEEADAVLDAVVGQRARVALERGRLRNSAGRRADAVQLFQTAAREAPDAFLRVDALHMLAIADAERAEDWTSEALSVLRNETHPRTLRWKVSLLYNLGWARSEAGDKRGARSAFENAAKAADEVGTDEQRAYTRETLAEFSAE
jgi:tetratricopeptide (TPR) repeat protein